MHAVHHGGGSPMELRELHQAVVHYHHPYASPGYVFLVADLGPLARVDPLSVHETSGRAWQKGLRSSQRATTAAGFSLRRGYVFAYSPQARQFAETLREKVEADGWVIVHADRTGCRVAVPPAILGSEAIDTPETASGTDTVPGARTGTGSETVAEPGDAPTVDVPGADAEDWLSISVREQRLNALQAARQVFLQTLQSPQAQLPKLSGEQMAAVHDALSDIVVQVSCLTWRDAASVQMWRHISAVSPGRLGAVASAVLACTLYQRGEQDEAVGALEKAHQVVHAGLAAENSPAGSAGPVLTTDAGYGPIALLAGLVNIVAQILVHQFDQFAIDELVQDSVRAEEELEKYR